MTTQRYIPGLNQRPVDIPDTKFIHSNDYAFYIQYDEVRRLNPVS